MVAEASGWSQPRCPTLGAVIPILGGLGAAICWSVSILCSSQSARRIGALSSLAWVMLVGCVFTLPAVALAGPVNLGAREVSLLAVSGITNVVGILFVLTALRSGKVSVVAPITSTEGAIAAVIAVIAGEQLAPGAGLVLGAIVVGVVLAASERHPEAIENARFGPITTALLALAAASCFGINLYVSGLIGQELPLAWSALPARLTGVLLIAIPLILLRRLRLTRAAAPFVLVTGLTEVLGIASFAFGAREGIAIASVISSQFAAIAAVAAVILLRERLARVQVVGVATISVGVAVLSYLTSA
jgi:drug/metabolite transporter (DMT)-like permease